VGMRTGSVDGDTELHADGRQRCHRGPGLQRRRAQATSGQVARSIHCFPPLPRVCIPFYPALLSLPAGSAGAQPDTLRACVGCYGALSPCLFPTIFVSLSLFLSRVSLGKCVCVCVRARARYIESEYCEIPADEGCAQDARKLRRLSSPAPASLLRKPRSARRTRNLHLLRSPRRQAYILESTLKRVYPQQMLQRTDF
jgi:hypothetical protein